jgi:hypothetical protein
MEKSGAEPDIEFPAGTRIRLLGIYAAVGVPDSVDSYAPLAPSDPPYVRVICTFVCDFQEQILTVEPHLKKKHREIVLTYAAKVRYVIERPPRQIEMSRVRAFISVALPGDAYAQVRDTFPLFVTIRNPNASLVSSRAQRVPLDSVSGVPKLLFGEGRSGRRPVPDAPRGGRVRPNATTDSQSTTAASPSRENSLQSKQCFGDACEDVVISFQSGCELVINDGRRAVEVRNADKNGRKTVGIVTFVHARSSQVVRNIDGTCMTKYYVVGKYRADYAQ